MGGLLCVKIPARGFSGVEIVVKEASARNVDEISHGPRHAA